MDKLNAVLDEYLKGDLKISKVAAKEILQAVIDDNKERISLLNKARFTKLELGPGKRDEIVGRAAELILQTKELQAAMGRIEG